MPYYTYKGALGLIGVNTSEPKDGTYEYYKVEATDNITDENLVIPGEVNGIPVTNIERIHNSAGSMDWDNYNKNIKSITLGEGVENLSNNALAYTPDLANVNLPSTLKTMGKNTFSRNFWEDGNKKLTIKYNGTGGDDTSDWEKLVAASDAKWAGGLAAGTTIECTNGSYTLTDVDTSIRQDLQWVWTPNPTN